MKFKRLFAYIVFIIIYALLSFPIASLNEIFKDLNISLIIGFGILNILFAKYLFKKINFKNILISFVISSLSVLMIYIVSKLRIAPNFDDYGIYTSIMTNAVTSVILWEVFYQIMNKKEV